MKFPAAGNIRYRAEFPIQFSLRSGNSAQFPLQFLMFHTHFLNTQRQEIQLLSQCRPMLYHLLVDMCKLQGQNVKCAPIHFRTYL